MKAPDFPGDSPWLGWRGSLWVMAGVGAVWWLCFRFPLTWVLTGIGEAHRPFLDLYALLAACDAIKLGMDPLFPNPLDPYNRPFGFSSWWFELGALGLGRKDNMWLGPVLLGMSLVTAVAMVRPKGWRECLSTGLFLISPAWLLSVNRANQDLVILIVVSLGLVCFRGDRGPARALGILLYAAAAVLKFFPLVTLVLLLDFRTRRAVLAGLGLYVVVLVLAWPGVEPALRLAVRHAPTPDWLYAFGAPVLLRDFGSNSVVGWLVPAGLVLFWAGREAWRDLRKLSSPRLTQEESAEREFICGAAMLVGIFFLGVSYSYKLVFAIWLLPWIWRQRPGEPGYRWFRLTWILVLAVAWLEGAGALGLNLMSGRLSAPVEMGLLKALLAVTQLLTWVLIACLARFLFVYIARRGRSLLTTQT